MQTDGCASQGLSPWETGFMERTYMLAIPHQTEQPHVRTGGVTAAQPGPVSSSSLCLSCLSKLGKYQPAFK